MDIQDHVIRIEHSENKIKYRNSYVNLFFYFAGKFHNHFLTKALFYAGVRYNTFISMHWTLQSVCELGEEDIISTSSSLFLGCITGIMINHSIVNMLSNLNFNLKKLIRHAY
jgi:hypothetical protein